VLLDDSPVEQTVRRIHTLQADLLHHEQASLGLAQRCSAVPSPAPLFTALLNYRHSEYDDDGAAGFAQGDAGLMSGRFRAVEDRFNYPLCMAVDELAQRFDLEVHTVRPLDATQMSALMTTALNRVVDMLERAPHAEIHATHLLAGPQYNDRKDTPDAASLVHQPYAAPSTSTELALAAIWSELLDLDADTIGIHDNFFALGGHSLLALKAVAEAKSRGLDLPLSAMFTQPDLRSLAHCVDQDLYRPLAIQASEVPA